MHLGSGRTFKSSFALYTFRHAACTLPVSQDSTKDLIWYFSWWPHLSAFGNCYKDCKKLPCTECFLQCLIQISNIKEHYPPKRRNLVQNNTTTETFLKWCWIYHHCPYQRRYFSLLVELLFFPLHLYKMFYGRTWDLPLAARTQHVSRTNFLLVKIPYSKPTAM